MTDNQTRIHERWTAKTPDGAKKYMAIQHILAMHRGSA